MGPTKTIKVPINTANTVTFRIGLGRRFIGTKVAFAGSRTTSSLEALMGTSGGTGALKVLPNVELIRSKDGAPAASQRACLTKESDPSIG
jgi:hypothetical protein